MGLRTWSLVRVSSRVRDVPSMGSRDEQDPRRLEKETVPGVKSSYLRDVLLSK